MDQVRIGIIGCGGMAGMHMAYLPQDPRVRFTAAADVAPDLVAKVVEAHGVEGFDDGEKLLDSGLIDAVIIVTPHYFHPIYSIAALRRGIHVMTEKPVAVTAKAAAEVNAEHQKHPDLVYGVMHQMRADPRWQRVHQIIHSGVLGSIQRYEWTVTSWFRTQAYFDSGSWRATWAGEGGGVLLNQSVHNLDLLCWLFGLPSRVLARVMLGKYHEIEVDDDVTAIIEYESGMSGVFITTTGEAPGMNRLEGFGDRGRLTFCENQDIIVGHLDQSSAELIRTSELHSSSPPVREERIAIEAPDGRAHHIVMAAFIDAIVDGTRPVVSAEDGLYVIELVNAIIMSGLHRRPIDIPTDHEAYESLLQKLIDEHRT